MSSASSADEPGEEVLRPHDRHALDLAKRQQVASVAADEQVGSAGERRREDPIVGGITAPRLSGSRRRQTDETEIVKQGDQVLWDPGLNPQLLLEDPLQLGKDQTGNQELERLFGSHLEHPARRPV